MEEIILCKYGEIALKGANRKYFENMLCRELARVTAPHGTFSVSRAQSTVTIRPTAPGADMEAALDAVSRVFGIVGVSIAAVTEKDMEKIKQTVREWVPAQLAGVKTFKVDARRSDKTFPLSSPEISAIAGGEILSVMPRLKVDVHNPDVVVRVEIRDEEAYVHAGQRRGAGGMPVGSSGRGLLLLSGGIDSPVAGYRMARRGLRIDALHFESFPYTSERAKEKVLALAEKMSAYCGEIHVHIISVTHIQEELRDKCDEDYFTLLLRRFMMRLANRTAKDVGCGCLVTGESLGQVASQTMEALHVTNVLAEVPVFRPLIGLDKEEIIETARAIDTFELSILPYEDCCTVFTPRHPRTKPELYKVEREEAKVDVAALVEEAYATRNTVKVGCGQA